MGNVTSQSALLTLCSTPSKPFPAPSVVFNLTTVSQIAVNFTNLNLDNGGSRIISTELSMDDGRQGDFRVILVTNT